MKKKVIIPLIITICLLTFNSNVKAAEVCEFVSPTFVGIIRENLNFTIGGTTKEAHFYQQFVNGKPALCLNMGGTSSKNYKFLSAHKLADSSYSYNLKKQFNRVYNFLMVNPNDLNRFVVAQVAAWHLVATGGLNVVKLRESVISAFCAIKNQNYGYKNACAVGGFGYQYIDQTSVNRAESYRALYNSIVDLLAELYTTSQADLYDLAIFKTSDGSNPQPLLAPDNCKDKKYKCTTGYNDGYDEEDMTTCVDNAMEKGGAKESAAIKSCTAKICKTPIDKPIPPNTPDPPTLQTCSKIVTDGELPVCHFSNYNNSSTLFEKVEKYQVYGTCENEANQYGAPEDSDFVANTCKFYCLESVTQSFPGHVTPALSKGTILVWPTSNTNNVSLSKNIYPLYYEGARRCTLVIYGSADDIDNKKSPIDIYNSYYNYVNANAGSRGSINNSRVTDSCSGRTVFSAGTVKTYEEIRTLDMNLSLNPSSCDNYYASLKQHLNNLINDYQNQVNNWVAANRGKCSSTFTMTPDGGKGLEPLSCKSGYTLKKQGIQWICEKTESRDCRADEAPCIYDVLQRLRDALSKLNATISSCKTYVNNYRGMYDTYKSVVACNNADIDFKSLYNFQSDTDVSFENADGGYETVTLKKESEVYSCNNCKQENLISVTDNELKAYYAFRNNAKMLPSNFKALVESMHTGGSRQRSIEVNVNTTYTLPNDKENDWVTEDKGNGNYTEAKYNGFKISNNSEIGKKYDLIVKNLTLGHDGAFNEELDRPNYKYVCNYEVTETVTDDCICPPGTDHEGEDLYCMIYDNNTTCIEAQVDYCNDSSITIPDYCPPIMLCPNDKTINLSACINSGYDYDYCEDLLCNGENVYRCKNNNMSITSCVYTKMAQGMSESKAYDACDALLCHGSGLRVIYRTISLENPFPGKTISGGISGFNTDVNGRYPGTNWNSKSVVTNDILYSRKNIASSYGSKIYQNEEPLYTFVLNTGTINAIRNYNNSHDYDDFELDCKKNDATACVSSFVHDTGLSGLTSGACKNNTSASNFYTCSND